MKTKTILIQLLYVLFAGLLTYIVSGAIWGWNELLLVEMSVIVVLASFAPTCFFNSMGRGADIADNSVKRLLWAIALVIAVLPYGITVLFILQDIEYDGLNWVRLSIIAGPIISMIIARYILYFTSPHHMGDYKYG